MIEMLGIALVLNFIHAPIDAYRIKKRQALDGRDINHLPGAVIYTALCVLASVLCGNVWYAIPMLLIRPVIFNPLLNLTRKPPKSIFYVSKKTTAFIDQQMNKFTTDGFAQWLIWIGLTLLSMFLIRIL